jgi:hypothetical protein
MIDMFPYFPSTFPRNVILNDSPDVLFYVSYLPYSEDYGSNTTALVVGQMQRFYILNGDFRKEYSALIPHGFEKCYEFFKNNLEHRNEKNSDVIEPVENLIILMNDYQDFLIRTRKK